MVAAGRFRTINRDPDEIGPVRFTDNPSGGTGLLHGSAGIWAQNNYTA